MFGKEDCELLAAKGISGQQIEDQLSSFRKGFPFLDIMDSAAVGKGITAVPNDRQTAYMQVWEEWLTDDTKKAVKFVPASGAASRMFKDLFAFLSSEGKEPLTPFMREFFDGLPRFAFYDALNEKCRQNEKQTVAALIAAGNYKAVVSNLLEPRGLNYGNLPKGLLLFHTYPDKARTAMEEHLVEGARYTKNRSGEVKLHFTVSPEHRALFETLVTDKQSAYEDELSVHYDITFSTQKQHTDTIAVDKENHPFRNADGSLLFRPGGHGALIENLNDIDADIVFIKNIDNVVPDSYKSSTIIFKKVIAGLLVTLQKRIFDYIRLTEGGKYTRDQIQEMLHFLQNDLCIRNPETKYLEDADLILYIKNKLNRPLRVCGMVRNVGEPGGGPFLAVNADGTNSPQILESSQIDMSDPTKKALFEQGTHFNPVDLVCSLKNHRGEKYNLLDYTDKNTGFISSKSKDGRELKALELPGLWNGAMSDWNTVFVEVPVETFNPVKTVNDLLRTEHQ
ncbi:putative ATPase/kinase involved in NAD metabolism [Bacteroidales bacterium Barb6]|nr:putative ATPase/kinase involved in NAD metabolism [Bacteroidales bacterium Barb6]OAV73537.1 putative ATPase/kinase involved in NAD metabolism [Bacteroidales bacterium Barb6]